MASAARLGKAPTPSKFFGGSFLLLASLLGLTLAGCTAMQPREATEPEAPAAAPGFFTGPSLPEIADELIRMGAADQDVRRKIIALGNANPPPELIRKLIETDQNNTTRLKAIIRRYGWPTRALVGGAAAEAAWMIAQHADQDPAFQARVLALIEPLAGSGEVDPSNFALLTDRVRVARSRPQLYGTQYQVLERGGELFLNPATPIEDPPGLDARRAAVGLGPHSEYVEQLRRMYLSQTATP